MEVLIESFQIYYGLDWLLLLSGLLGTYLISKKSKMAFVAWVVTCVCGSAVAVISMQYGLLAYNLVVLVMYLRSLQNWTRMEREEAVVAAE